MEQLQQQGKVTYIGSSNFAAWHIAQAQEEAKRRPFMGLVSEQSLYNLRERMIELEVIPACRAYGVGVIPYSPLAGGLLGGALQRPSVGRRASDDIRKQVEQYRHQLEAYEKLCKEIGELPGDVALAWVLCQKGITSAIIGPRTPEQLDGSLRALQITLSADALTRLDGIFPGPGGAAPEAYAW
jgi:aryl-alcohol dehydrogenase-like predicted oxidoreductase